MRILYYFYDIHAQIFSFYLLIAHYHFYIDVYAQLPKSSVIYNNNYFLIHPDRQDQICIFISFERFDDRRAYAVFEIYINFFVFYYTESIF